MPDYQDGPSTSLFSPVVFQGNSTISDLSNHGISDEMVAAAQDAPRGSCVGWGLPFEIGDVILIKDKIVFTDVDPIQTEWLVFMHTSDFRKPHPIHLDFILRCAVKGSSPKWLQIM